MRRGVAAISMVAGLVALGGPQVVGPPQQVRFKNKPHAGLTAKRPPLQPIERLQRALQSDPAVADMVRLVAQALAEGLQGSNGPAARAARASIARYPRVDREILQRFIRDVGSIEPPPGATTKSLRIGQPGVVLSESQIDQGVARYLRAVAQPGRPGPAFASRAAKLDLKLAQDLVQRMAHPCITSIDPQPAGGHQPGQRVSFYGWKFSPNRSENRLVLYKVMGNGSLGERAQFQPAVCSDTAMEALLPNDLEPGHYRIKVVVSQSGFVDESPLVPLAIASPPPPAPSLAGWAPERPVPGREVLVSGANFARQPDRTAAAYLAPMEGQPLPFAVRVSGKDCLTATARVLNDNQLAFQLPRVMQPGRYRMAVSVGGSVSAWSVVDVAPLQYRVRFTQIHCLDESNPERLGHDEVFTVWCVVRDGFAKAKSVGDHSEYYNWDDDDWDQYHPDDQNVFPDADDGSVRQGLVVSTSLFEWDAGDMKRVSEAIGLIGDVMQALLKMKGEDKSAEFLKALTPVIQKVVSWCGGDPDPLGSVAMGWTAMELAAYTDNPNRRFVGRKEFRNSDDTGSYEGFFEVSEKL
ncbi:MAG: hypothetical protein N2109_08245 [Fimbriimonadales bacterium]|nr:hypothetical protein [Fimbriimonadales bacterium]